jgi:transposase InsO family protein
MSQNVNWLIEENRRANQRNRDLSLTLQTQGALIEELRERLLPIQDTHQTIAGMGENKGLQILKLNGKNYRTWSKEVEMVFKELELWNLLLGNLKNLGPGNEREYTTKEKEKGYRILYQACDDTHREIIVNLTDPKSAWDKLLKLYKPDNAMSRLMAMKEFFDTKIKPNENMDVYLRRHNQNYREYVSAGQQELSDAFLAQHLLLSLSEEFDYIRSITNTLKIEDLTTQRVSDILLSEWKQRELKTSSESSYSSIYFTRSKKTIPTETGKAIRCYRCKRIGHKIKDCKSSPDNTSSNPESHNTKRGGVAATCLKVEHKGNKNGNYSPQAWIVDSAASCHITNDISDFSEYEESSDELVWGTTSTCKAKGKGQVQIKCIVGNQTETFVMKSVLFVPDFKYKVFAMGAATRHRMWTFIARGKTITALRDGCLNFVAEENSENFYLAEFEVVKTKRNNESCNVERPIYHEDSRNGVTESEGEKEESCVMTTKSNKMKSNEKKGKDSSKPIVKHQVHPTADDTTELWHRRMGHTSFRKIKDLKDKDIVRGMENGKISATGETCDCCLQMKGTRLKFNKGERLRATGKLDLIHTDVCGPMRVKSAGGALYVLTFLDDYSRKSDIYLLKSKSEVFEKFKAYKARVERETGRLIKILRSDNGSEFKNNKMDSYMTESGIKREFTTVYTPQQNGGAERLNRTLIEKTRCLLKDAHMPEEFWGEAILTANFIRNHTQTKICGDFVPMELWSGRKPSVKYFRIFGCLAYATLPRPNWKGKFSPRALKGVFVGYDEGRKAYRIWSEEQQKILHSRDVRFVEQENGFMSHNEGSNQLNITDEGYVLIDLSDVNPNLTVEDERSSANESQEVQVVCERDTGDDSEENGEESKEGNGEESEEENGKENEGEDGAENQGHVDVTNRWADRTNLRERNSTVRPVKYSMIAQTSHRQEPSVEELMREYGWRKDDW